MKRRSFLEKGFAGAALLALGGAGLALYPTKHLADPPSRLLVLDDRAFQVMVAIAARVIPSGDATAIAASVDATLAHAVIEAQKDINDVLHLFESALPGLLLDGRATPFTRLDGDAQDKVLANWRDSRITLRRGAYQALRKLALSAHYARAATWKALHYGGPPSPNFQFDDSQAGTPAWIAANEGQKP
jgi:hypothetical protein